MKKLKLVSTKTLIPFEEFISRNRFQFPDGVYQSRNGLIHLSFISPVFENILFSDQVSGRIKLPKNFIVEQYRLMKPASCIEMRSEVGYKRAFTMQTFLATIWSLMYEQGESISNFIYENCLYLFHVKYPDGTFETASMMLQNVGAYYDYSININPPRMYEDTWCVSSNINEYTYLLVPVKN